MNTCDLKDLCVCVNVYEVECFWELEREVQRW